MSANLAGRNGESRHTRRHVIGDRDGWQCRYCLRLVTCQRCDPGTAHPMTVDHVLAKVFGGTKALANQVTACEPCNQAKGHQLIQPLPLHRVGA